MNSLTTRPKSRHVSFGINSNATCCIARTAAEHEPVNHMVRSVQLVDDDLDREDAVACGSGEAARHLDVAGRIRSHTAGGASSIHD